MQKALLNATYVSLLVRLWVEIINQSRLMSWKLSASLWGCELKWQLCKSHRTALFVSLLVRLWVEIQLWMYWKRSLCQPPCEAVSWNRGGDTHANRYYVSLLVRLWVEIIATFYLWQKESVSLLVRLWVEILLILSKYDGQLRQPPCEAVSWNLQ